MQVIVHPRSRSPLRAEANIAACRHHGWRPLTFNGTSFPSLCSLAVCNEDRPSSLGSIKRSFFSDQNAFSHNPSTNRCLQAGRKQSGLVRR